MKRTLPLIFVFLSSFLLLAIIQIKVETPMLLAERFIENGGWIEIAFLSGFAAFLYSRMINVNKTTKWRTIAWGIFSLVFFTQLGLGLAGYEKFLMSGELHLPVPAIIAGGAIYRMEISFMPILLIATILISGPAWCSQLCYFGSIDYLLSQSAKKTFKLALLMRYKSIVFALFFIAVILLRIFDVSSRNAAIAGGAFGIAGLLIILIFSSRKGSMIHCVLYCPISMIVSLGKYINPFRMYIDDRCDHCMKCSNRCRYFALDKKSIVKGKPGLTCTYCGDCIPTCPSGSIKYRFFSLKPEIARKLYLGLTIVLYAVFLGLARI